MKRERVQFLVTVSLGYETPAGRRYAVKTARNCLLGTELAHVARPVKATLVKSASPRRASPVQSGRGYCLLLGPRG